MVPPRERTTAQNHLAARGKYQKIHEELQPEGRVYVREGEWVTLPPGSKKKEGEVAFKGTYVRYLHIIVSRRYCVVYIAAVVNI